MTYETKWWTDVFALVFITLFFCSTIGGLMYLADKALIGQEIEECHQLKHYSETIKSFYLEQWQKDMCDAHDINIEATVSGPNSTVVLLKNK